jgi:tripartite-type tricarboxylate transporter receptor subunit TctC
MDRRKSIFALLTAFCAIVYAPAAALAQTYPSRPIKLIVPFASGGATDLYARTLGAALSVELGQ